MCQLTTKIDIKTIQFQSIIMIIIIIIIFWYCNQKGYFKMMSMFSDLIIKWSVVTIPTYIILFGEKRYTRIILYQKQINISLFSILQLKMNSNLEKELFYPK